MSPSERTLRYLSTLKPREFSESFYKANEDLADAHFDREGEPISFTQWVLLYHDEYKLVAQTQVGEIFVSTVWMGIDHSFGMGGKPIIFESMVFHDGDYSGVEQQRYCTEAQALLGHEELVMQALLLEELRDLEA